jgi:hypothetical protein
LVPGDRDWHGRTTCTLELTVVFNKFDTGGR